MGLIVIKQGETYPGDTDGEFTPRLGREIYDDHTRTSLNQIPVIIHLSYILPSNHRELKLKWQLEDVATRVIVEGSLASYKNKLLDGIERCEKGLVIQCFPDSDMKREFRQMTGGTWRIREYEEKYWEPVDPDTGEYPKDISLELTVPASAVWHYPNGSGILFYAQRTLNEIENRAERLDRNMSGSALSNIITGYLGNIAQAQSELEAGKRNVIFPGKDAKVTRVGSTMISDQLRAELQDMVRFYFLQTRMVDASYGVNTSADSRLLKMSTMLQFVKTVQDDLKIIFAPAKIEFPTIQVMSAKERTEEELLISVLEEKGAISPEEANSKRRLLAP